MAAARVFRWTAFILALLMGAVGGLFTAGYAFEDPGGWAAVGLTAAWLLPLAVLSVLALWRPDVAGPVIAGLILLLFLVGVGDAVLGGLLRRLGPVGGVSLLVVAVALGFLGLKRSRMAGLLLVSAAVLQMIGVAVGFLMAPRVAGEGPGVGALLGGSSGVLVVPVLVLGLLFLVAASAGGERLSFRRDRPVAPGSAGR